MLQEVTLRKSGSAEKLGLTVCYSSGSGSEDADTEVYISEIVPESLAARDGRLREGDQILRVKFEKKNCFYHTPPLFSIFRIKAVSYQLRNDSSKQVTIKSRTN